MAYIYIFLWNSLFFFHLQNHYQKKLSITVDKTTYFYNNNTFKVRSRKKKNPKFLREQGG